MSKISSQHFDVTAVGAPTKLAYNMLKFTPMDWLVITVTAIIWLIVASIYNPILAMVFPTIPGVLLLIPRNNGRVYYVSTMNIYGRVWIDWVLQGWLYSAKPREDVKLWRRALQRIFIEPQVFPSQIDDLGGYGVLFSSRLGTDTIAVEVDGWNYSGMNPDQHVVQRHNLEDIITAMTNIKGIHPRISLVARLRPVDLSELQVNQYLMFRDAVFNQKAVPGSAYNRLKERGMSDEDISDEAVVALYHEGVITRDDVVDYRNYMVQTGDVYDSLTEHCRQLDSVILVTIPQTAQLKAARRRKVKGRKQIDRSHVERQEIVRLTKQLILGLEGIGVTNPHVLTKAEYEDFHREGWDADPVSITEYREWRLEHPDEDRSQPEKFITTDGAMVCIDGTWHLTMRLTGLPKFFKPDTAMRLFEYLPPLRSYVTRSEVAEVVRDTSEYIKTMAAFNIVTSLFEAIGGTHRFGHKATRSQERLEKEQEQLDQEANVNWFSLYLSLAHTNPEVIREDADLVKMAITRIGAGYEEIVGSAWTYKAARSALYGNADM